MGPPVTKRPVGLMWYLVFLSTISAGRTGLMTSFRTASCSVLLETLSLCCVEMTTVSTRAGSAIDIFNCYLGFSVRAKEIDRAFLADFR